MEIDFYQQFTNYSTIDLLKIVKKEEEYQPEAVLAAKRLLHEREVSLADLEMADQYFREMEAEKTERMTQVSSYKKTVSDLVEPIVTPNNMVSPVRSFRLFMVAYVILYLYTFYRFIVLQLHFLRCKDCRGDFTLWGSYINLIFLSIVFILLVKRQRWGWILSLIGNLSAIFTNISQLHVLYKYRQIFQVDVALLVFTQVYPIALVFFLWKPAIAGLFDVDDRTKKRAGWGGVILGFLYVGIIQLL